MMAKQEHVLQIEKLDDQYTNDVSNLIQYSINELKANESNVKAMMS